MNAIIELFPGRNHTVPDFCTKDGAFRLAKRIQQKWHDLGHANVRVWVCDAAEESRHGLYVVRSNLVNGLPPK